MVCKKVYLLTQDPHMKTPDLGMTVLAWPSVPPLASESRSNKAEMQVKYGERKMAQLVGTVSFQYSVDIIRS